MFIVEIFKVLDVEGRLIGLYASKQAAFDSVSELHAQSPFNDVYWMMNDDSHFHKADIELCLLPQLHIDNLDLN